MKALSSLLLLVFWATALGANLPVRHTELLPFVQPAPDQGETNTCWFVASTGAMELLLNKRDNIRSPKIGGKYDLSESFLIWQKDPRGEEPTEHFIEDMVRRFNLGEAIHVSAWPFKAYNEDGTDNMDVWAIHPNFVQLPRLQVPPVKTELLFARGKKWDTYVLDEADITTVKETLVRTNSPVIINYNDDGYWHVVLIVGYDDEKKGICYEIEEDECNKKGAFYVRDSNGNAYESRAYNWFLYRANAAAVVELNQKTIVFANR